MQTARHPNHHCISSLPPYFAVADFVLKETQHRLGKREPHDPTFRPKVAQPPHSARSQLATLPHIFRSPKQVSNQAAKHARRHSSHPITTTILGFKVSRSPEPIPLSASTGEPSPKLNHHTTTTYTLHTSSEMALSTHTMAHIRRYSTRIPHDPHYRLKATLATSYVVSALALPFVPPLLETRRTRADGSYMTKYVICTTGDSASITGLAMEC